MTKRIEPTSNDLTLTDKQIQEALSQTLEATIPSSPTLRLTPVEEEILETLDVIQGQLDHASEQRAEILDRIEDLQVKLEDIECNIQYSSGPIIE